MRIHKKVFIIFFLLSLVPMTVTGGIAYKSAEDIIQTSQGVYFQRLANEVITTVERTFSRLMREVEKWSMFDVMQEVVIDDVDGKISSFLIQIQKHSKDFSSIFVLNGNGIAIASSTPGFINNKFDQFVYFSKAKEGHVVFEDAYFDPVVHSWVVTFAVPIQAKFKKDQIIGVLCAQWNVSQLNDSIRAVQKNMQLPRSRFLLLRKDGSLLASTDNRDSFQMDLRQKGLSSIEEVIQNKSSYRIERDERGQLSLIGYDFSKGLDTFSGLGWAALAMQDIRMALAPVYQLRALMIFVGGFVILFVFLFSLLIAGKMTVPLIKITEVARKVTKGNFKERVNYSAKDEIGELVMVFNKMIEDLNRLILEEKKLAAQTAIAEIERAKAFELSVAYEELKQTQNQLVQNAKMATIGTLSSGVAHELKNPLAIILQAIERIEQIFYDKSNEKGLQYMTMIKNAAMRANKIVISLLQFSRSSTIDMKLLQIHQVIKAAIELINNIAQKKRIKITEDYAPEVYWVNGNETVIEQIFFNLFVNAMDAMPNGGEIRITTSKLEDVKPGQKPMVVIKVTDTGVGIEDQNLKKIFDPFFTTKPQGQGTGLGLSMVDMLLERHSGSIDVESQKGNGATFTILLPLVKNS